MNKSPLLKLVVFFILGIFCGIHYEWNSKSFVVLFLISLLTSFSIEYILSKTLRFKKILVEIILLLTVFFSGVSILIIQKDSNKSNYFPKLISSINNIDYSSEVRILSPIKLKRDHISFEGEVETVKFRDSIFNVSGKAMVYLLLDSNSSKLIPDDLIAINSKFLRLKDAQNPAQFNYSNYLKNKQIEYSTYGKTDWKYLSYKVSIKRLASICKSYCLKAFKNIGLENDHFALATALTFGHRDNLDKNIKQIFSSTGAMHVLAVSGLHVGILYLLVLFLFSCFNVSSNSSWIASSVLLIIIWTFAFITGMSSSVMRSVTMFSFFIIGDLFNKSTNGYNLLSASAILLLVFNPFLITQVSFQLSYFAVLGILFFYPKIEKLFIFKNWIFKKIWSVSAVSIAAQITTFPLGLYYFHQFPNYFLITNLIVIPLAFILFSLGLFVILFSFSKVISLVIGDVINIIVKLMLSLVEFVANTPGALIKEISIGSIETALIYLIILLFTLYFSSKYRFISYLLFCSIGTLFIINLNEDNIIAKQKMIIVYKIKNHFAMDLIDGRNHFFIADELLMKNKDKIEFFINQNWLKLDLRPPNYIEVDSLLTKAFKWQGKKIAITDDENIIKDSLDFKIMVQHFFDSTKKVRGIKTEKIIVSSKINSSKRNNLNNPNYNTNFKIGAYIHRL